MTPPLTLLHCADSHCRTFDTLRDTIAPGTRITHEVRADWLARARRDGMTRQLAAEIRKAVQAAPGHVLCTCTTLGEAAVEAGAIRIDQPMMQAAAGSEGAILLVCALQSTVAPSRGLLDANLRDAENDAAVTTLTLEEFWPLFERGDTANFCAAIAAAVIEALEARPDFQTVVLAQASMADAALLLDGCGARVLASPEIALRAALELT